MLVKGARPTCEYTETIFHPYFTRNKNKHNMPTKKTEKKALVKSDAKLVFPEPAVNTLKSVDDLHLFKCPNCGGVHFRHAGYLEVQMPYINTVDPQLKVEMHSEQVKVCVACKHCHIIRDAKIWDVTKYIDLAAWEKTEKEAHKATGPGGQC